MKEEISNGKDRRREGGGGGRRVVWLRMSGWKDETANKGA